MGTHGLGQPRQRKALRLIGIAFVAVAAYVSAQSTIVLLTAHHGKPSVVGIGWTGLTAAVTLNRAAAKSSTGHASGNSVLHSEGRVTLIDAVEASAVTRGLTLNAAFGRLGADPLAGYMIVVYGGREAGTIFTGQE